MPVAWAGPYPFWDTGVTLRGNVVDMRHALNNFKGGGDKPAGFPDYVRKNTIYDSALTRKYRYNGDFTSPSAQAHAAAIEAGYVPYYPYKSRMSPFYKQSYFWWPIKDSDASQTATGLGVSNTMIFYSFQTTLTRFISNNKADYDTNGNTVPTGASAVNYPYSYNNEFNYQCEHLKTADGSSTTCNKASATFAQEDNNKNYFVQTCGASVDSVVANVTKASWTTNDWYGAVDSDTYSQAYVTNALSAADNGGCGGSNYIGKNGELVDLSQNGIGYHSYLKFPFTMTYSDGEAAKGDATNSDTQFHQTDDGNTLGNVALNVYSRMSQKQALHHAQGAFWMCIVVVQWADLLICKTRWLSIATQGMSNDTMNFGLFFETLLAAYLAYFSPFQLAFGTRDIRVAHWFCAMPFSMLIFGYDETRKALMRATSPVKIDKKTGQSIRTPGWLERNTYY